MMKNFPPVKLAFKKKFKIQEGFFWSLLKKLYLKEIYA